MHKQSRFKIASENNSCSKLIDACKTGASHSSSNQGSQWSEFLPDQVATPGAAADENSQRRQPAPAGLRGPPWRYHVAAERLHSHVLANHLLVPNENFRFAWKPRSQHFSRNREVSRASMEGPRFRILKSYSGLGELGMLLF